MLRHRFQVISLAITLLAVCSGRSSSVPAVKDQPAKAQPTQAGAARAPAAQVAGRRVTMDLVANRLLAIPHDAGRLVVDCGSAAFHKFVDGGWKTSWIFGQRDGADRVAMVAGLSSLVFLPVDADGDGPGVGEATLGFTLRALAPKQRVSVFVNEKPIGTVDVADDAPAAYTLAVPAGALKSGDNRVRFTFRATGTFAGKSSAAAFRTIVLGPPKAAASGAHALAAVDRTLGGTSRRAVEIAGGPSRLSYYVQAAAGSALAVGVGAEKPGATAIVRMSVDGQKPRVLHEAPVGSGWNDVALDLGLTSDQAVRIDLVARGGAVSWAEPRILAAAAGTPASAAAPVPAKKFDKIFVWMVDTLRADKVRAYNPKTRVQTPTYDAFAADATRFEWAHVPGTWSLPSHASLLTGVYPTVHKAVAHEAKLAREVPFVAEVFKKAGFKTAIFSSNGYVSSKWGFDRGWDESRNFIREEKPNGADYLWNTAKPWILANRAKPEFVYLATVEPHVIYNPKKEFLARYWPKTYSGPIKPTMTGIQLGHIKSGKLKINDNDKAYLEALHDAEITQSDAVFAQFIADLKQSGLYDTSAIIVVSDHGDEFWDHGGCGHAQSVYQELVHVPLMIRAPGLLKPGRVVSSDVEIMDVAVTLLDLAGIQPTGFVQGSSLLTVANDESSLIPRAALSMENGLLRGLKVARYKLVHGGPSRLELYDEIEDRREKRNIADERPIALRHMRNVFGILYVQEAKWNKARWGTAANVTPAFLTDLGEDRPVPTAAPTPGR